jgi:hypothetical protein
MENNELDEVIKSAKLKHKALCALLAVLVIPLITSLAAFNLGVQ